MTYNLLDRVATEVPNQSRGSSAKRNRPSQPKASKREKSNLPTHRVDDQRFKKQDRNKSKRLESLSLVKPCIRGPTGDIEQDKGRDKCPELSNHYHPRRKPQTGGKAAVGGERRLIEKAKKQMCKPCEARDLVRCDLGDLCTLVHYHISKNLSNKILSEIEDSVVLDGDNQSDVTPLGVDLVIESSDATETGVGALGGDLGVDVVNNNPEDGSRDQPPVKDEIKPCTANDSEISSETENTIVTVAQQDTTLNTVPEPIVENLEIVISTSEKPLKFLPGEFKVLSSVAVRAVDDPNSQSIINWLKEILYRKLLTKSEVTINDLDMKRINDCFIQKRYDKNLFARTMSKLFGNNTTSFEFSRTPFNVDLTENMWDANVKHEIYNELYIKLFRLNSAGQGGSYNGDVWTWFVEKVKTSVFDMSEYDGYTHPDNYETTMYTIIKVVNQVYVSAGLLNSAIPKTSWSGRAAFAKG